jgi:putative ABC transport system permease protein
MAWYTLCQPKRNSTTMLKHYVIHFYRNLKRQKLFTFINILGLTVGIASSLLIYLYARHEFSYDRFHTNADRIYRVNQTFIWGESTDNEFASTGPGVAYAVNEEIPEVKLITSIHPPKMKSSLLSRPIYWLLIPTSSKCSTFHW